MMKILVIDDEPDILHVIESILIREGFEVDKATGMMEAKSKISSAGYDLIICDIMLPHWGGFDLVDAIKENLENHKTPVIVITGMDKDILESTHTFADMCIPKPFTGKQLIEAVNSLIKEV